VQSGTPCPKRDVPPLAWNDDEINFYGYAGFSGIGIKMFTVTLYGTPSCRRYKKMRDVILAEAQKLGAQIQLVEIGDTESLSKINPLSLPRLYVGDELLASQNPPQPDAAAQALRKMMTL
jgi:hypothetical protein